MKYIPAGKQEKNDLLKEIGINSFEDLIKHIPEHLRNIELNLDNGISEYELIKQVKEIASKNKTTSDYISFMGGGVYDHYIPPAIKHIILRPEFYTAYTPYQAEVSQGTLQVIYEYQSMIARIYGMEIANASMYDGSTATAEACHMAMTIKKKNKVLLSDGLHPTIKEVIDTYLKGQDIEYDFIKLSNGSLDIEELKNKINNDYAAFVLQTPNFFGIIEDIKKIGEIVNESGAMFIVNQNPMSLGILKGPGMFGADITIGEGQVFGIAQAFGGPLLGVFASKKKYARNMPGRIIGITEDTDSKRGFVMTMQTREQHIKREKATSNICTNEGLCMLMATLYLELIGKEGFYKVSKDSALAAHYLYDRIKEINKVNIVYSDKEFFNEFVVKIENLDEVYKKLKEYNVLGGVKLNRFNSKWKNMLLISATEKRTKEEIDYFIDKLKEVLK